MTENSRKDKLPGRPPGPSDKNIENSKKSNDYYIKIQATAALEKYKGRNKGLEVFLSSDDVTRLDELIEIFGNDFNINNIICAADYFLSRNDAQDIFDRGLINERFDKILKFKPNADSMLAILKHGKEISATLLTKLGVELLSSRLSKR